ncbi:hypothetical protein [Priestia megaterium]|uniref:hypothetical protein n=1 Tax=Priestia megaterium TaxID=1404 RepID=UPI002D7F3E63|nr:hypothetical protein [Priestia megaterium]MEB4860707.1 hypothetical protein [Priestia megaterium]
MNRLLITLCTMLTIIFFMTTLPISGYSDGFSSIEMQLKEQLKEKPDFDSSKPVKVVKVAKTPSKRYYIVLFTYSPYYTTHLGDAIFKKQKGRYTFVGGLASTDQNINNYAMYLDKVPYNLVYGLNEDNRIRTLRLATLDKKSSYNVPIKKGTYFVNLRKLPRNTDIEKMEHFYIMDCYDKKNKQIPWNECVE